MSIAKVVYKSSANATPETWIDVTQKTVAAGNLLSGETALKNDGTDVVGTYVPQVVVEEKQVNFIDYDGTILYSYTAQEANALTALPSNPSHTGLTAQGWNWTLQQIKDQLTVDPDGPVIVGQMYVTSNGKTEIDFVLEGKRLSPYLGIAVNGTVDVDWGDGTTHSTVTGSSLTTQTRTIHTYATPGQYTISISVTSGNFAFYGTTTYPCPLNKSSSSFSENANYAFHVTNIRIGNNATIGNYGFANLNAIKSVTIPQSITSFGTYAFAYCYSLKTLVIPKNVTTISERFIYKDNVFEVISIPYGVTSVSAYALAEIPAFRLVTLPNSITSLGTNIFYYNTVMRHLFIPTGLSSLSTEVFSTMRSLVKIVVPANISSYGTRSFAGCAGVAEYHFKRTTPATIQSTTFNDVPSDCIFYVPRSENQTVLNAYKAANNWSTHASKMQEEPA